MNNKCRCSSRPISWAIIVLLYVNDVAEKMRSINRLNAYESTLQQCSNNISAKIIVIVIFIYLRTSQTMAATVNLTKIKSGNF